MSVCRALIALLCEFDVLLEVFMELAEVNCEVAGQGGGYVVFRVH